MISPIKKAHEKMKNNNLLWVDFIRVVATFFVIVVHTCSSTIGKYNELQVSDWWTGNVYASVARVCVPLFFLLTGYLLLDKDEPIKVFFIKRTSKVILPLVVWSILYILWNRYYGNAKPITFSSFASSILAPAHFHLWFLYAIIGLYLYMPILRVLVRNSTKELLYYFVALWFIAVAVIPFVEKTTQISSQIDLKMISGFVGYLVLGHLLGKVRITRRYFSYAVLVAVTMVAITAVGTSLLTARDYGILNKYFYGYLSPNVILMAVSSFIVLKYLSEQSKLFFNNNKVKSSIQTISSASLGIYLIHIMVLDVLYNGTFGFSLSPASFSIIYSIPITAIAIFLVSFILIYMLKKILLIQKFIP